MGKKVKIEKPPARFFLFIKKNMGSARQLFLKF